jgi:predicted nucleotidyltransferase
MTQSQIAREIGRSQPEVNRLLRFRGSTPLAKTLRHHSEEVRNLIAAAGGRDVRVFGSTAVGDDGPDSDVDLLFDMRQPLSLMQLSSVEQQLSKLLNAKVDLVPESSLRTDLRDNIIASAVPL